MESFDVTPDLAAWSRGQRDSHGWAIPLWPDGGEGWGISISETAEDGDRPRLRVFYTPRGRRRE